REPSRRGADYRPDPVRPIAECELADDGLGHRREPRRRRQPADRLARLVGPDELLADEGLRDLDIACEGPQQLAWPVDDREARRLALAPVAEPDRGLDPRGRETGQGRGARHAPVLRGY